MRKGVLTVEIKGITFIFNLESAEMFPFTGAGFTVRIQLLGKFGLQYTQLIFM